MIHKGFSLLKQINSLSGSIKVRCNVYIGLQTVFNVFLQTQQAHPGDRLAAPNSTNTVIANRSTPDLNVIKQIIEGIFHRLHPLTETSSKLKPERKKYISP